MPHPSSRFRPRCSRTVIVAVATAAGFALAPVASAQTTPPNDTGTPLGRLAALDAATQALDTQITAAQHDLAARRAEFATAMRTANAAVDAARARGAEADALRKQMDGLVVAAFGGARTARLSANLISTSPQDLLDRMTALDLLGRDTSARMDGALAAEVSPSDQPRTPRRLEMRRSPRRDECRRGCRFRRRPDHLRVSSWNCALRRVGCSAGWASVSSLSGPLSNPYQDMTARPTAPVVSQAGRHVE